VNFVFSAVKWIWILRWGPMNRIEFDQSELLRFITAGSVDDGKSTLIGRLLHDSKTIFEDQLAAVERTTRSRGINGVDLSLLTDGLVAEREQGITIDVAYRYFSTPKRKFIIADTPGHEQYTRNMVTGASTANLAVILIDARNGVVTQSRRHAYIAGLVGIPHLVVAVNKMDLVGYSHDVFDDIREEFGRFAAGLNFRDIIYIPISALKGDMVVDRGENLPWYEGPALMELLENIDIDHDLKLSGTMGLPPGYERASRFPRLRGSHRIRNHHRGRSRGGVAFEPIVPRKKIFTLAGELTQAFAPQSVTLLLEDDMDISRGDMIVRSGDNVPVAKQFDADVCWLGEQSLDLRRKYAIKHTTKTAKAFFSQIQYRVDVNTLQHVNGISQLQMNDIARVSVKVQQPLVIDSYTRNRVTGSFIVIDDASHNTVAAGMIV
jgi:sulfate adenylyltransferase subunit 1